MAGPGGVGVSSGGEVRVGVRVKVGVKDGNEVFVGVRVKEGVGDKLDVSDALIDVSTERTVIEGA